MSAYLTVRLGAANVATFRKARLFHVWRSTNSHEAKFYSDVGMFPMGSHCEAQALADSFRGRGFSSIRMVTIGEPNRLGDIDDTGMFSYGITGGEKGKLHGYKRGRGRG